MMKKFIGFLTLMGFLVASNMQLVHATEMNHESMLKVHIMHETKDSIFCDNSNATSDENECYKDVIGDKFVNSIQFKQLKDSLTNVSSLFFQCNFQTIDSEINIKSHAPPLIIFQKSDYSNLSGIIKSLK